MTPVIAATIPAGSALRAWLANADFHDAWEAPLRDPSLSPTEIFLATIGATPAWVGGAMALRNRVVRLFGLKDVGSMRGARARPAESYRPGDRLGIFDVVSQSGEELVLGIDDRHLDVRVSVTKPGGAQAERYVVSTVVHIHNLLGRAYMVPVAPVHAIIVRAMMRRADV